MFSCDKSTYESFPNNLSIAEYCTCLVSNHMLHSFIHETITFWIHQNLPSSRNENIQFNFDNWKEKRFLCGIRKRNLSWEGSKHCHGNVAQWSDYGKVAYHLESNDI